MSDFEIIVEGAEDDFEIDVEAPPAGDSGGVPGPAGPPGKSAYEIAVLNGFVGSLW